MVTLNLKLNGNSERNRLLSIFKTYEEHILLNTAKVASILTSEGLYEEADLAEELLAGNRGNVEEAVECARDFRLSKNGALFGIENEGRLGWAVNTANSCYIGT